MRLVLAIIAAAIRSGGDSTAASARVDSARHEVVVTAGSWTLAADGGAHAGHAGHLPQPPARFVWPVDGWVHGMRFRAVTRDGRAVPRSLLHHLAIINLSRRDLFLQIPERLFEMGSETADIELPRTVGVPVTAGAPMAVTLAWSAAGTDALAEVSVELTIDWSPANSAPRPLSALLVTMQVITTAGETSFDLPPGNAKWATDYALGVDGRILAAGGHLHDYGTGIQLRDLSTPAAGAVIQLSSRRDAAGHVTGIERKMPGLTGNGIPLEAGHLYRLEGGYANPKATPVERGGMVFLVLLFAPTRVDDWPSADVNAASWKGYLEQTGLTGNGPAMVMGGLQHENR